MNQIDIIITQPNGNCVPKQSWRTASLVAGQMNAIRINQLEATQILRQQLQTLNTIAMNTSYNRYLQNILAEIKALQTSNDGSLRSQGLA